MPTAEQAWNWLVGFFPEDVRPLIAIIALVLFVIWVVARFVTTFIDLVSRFQGLLRRRQRENNTTIVPPLPPPPRQKVWDRPVENPPRPIEVSDGGIPIVSVATMKGGVGKTTIVANLAAHFDRAGKRVLLIDFDYQGSLSTMVTSLTGQSIRATMADALIEGRKPVSEILDSAISLAPKLEKTSILTSYYEFSDTETEVMLSWLRPLPGDAPVGDVRFRLTSLLRDPAVQSAFDIVLIDTPPRFTTSTINALCASTHLLIPSVLDQMSAEAAVYFSRDIAAMRQRLFPNLQLLGVVPTFTYKAESMTIREQGVVDYLDASMRPFWGGADWVREEACIPRKSSIGDVAGKGIAYVDAGSKAKTTDVQAIFDRLAKLVFAKVISK
jgi:chromosome partitioning protein